MDFERDMLNIGWFLTAYAVTLLVLTFWSGHRFRKFLLNFSVMVLSFTLAWFLCNGIWAMKYNQCVESHQQEIKSILSRGQNDH